MTGEHALARSHRLLWEGLATSNKGPRPSLTLEQIIAAGIAIADADGLEALSMRRIATELEVGTMSLYRYVPTKADLLNLMLDQVAGAETANLVHDQGWREALRSSAWLGRKLYLDHPWLLQVNWSRPLIGPNSLFNMEVTVSGLKDLPLRDRETIAVISLLDAYVVGSVRQEIQYARAAVETGVPDDDFWEHQLPVLVAAMESGRFPTLAAMTEDAFTAEPEEVFAWGLDFLLDGLDRELARRMSG